MRSNLRTSVVKVCTLSQARRVICKSKLGLLITLKVNIFLWDKIKLINSNRRVADKMAF